MKIRSSEELKGMTVNERLYETDQLDAYDAAVTSQNEDALRQVLERLHIGESNVIAIIDSEIKRSDR